MEAPSKDIVVSIIIASLIIVGMTVFMLLFFLLYIKKKGALRHENEKIKHDFEKNLLQARIEVQEQTLSHVSREIHDNIGQVLSFIKLSLSTTKRMDKAGMDEKVDECKELVSHVINDLRDLSKSLSMEHFSNKGLIKTISEDIDRLNKLNVFSAEFKLDGSVYPLGSQRELVIYRIFQESVNNCIKHSNANHLKINLRYSPELFNLTVEDDGLGFSQKDKAVKEGSGLQNMQNRAGLIGASLNINSLPDKGCRVSLSLNPSQPNRRTNGEYKGSIS